MFKSGRSKGFEDFPRVSSCVSRVCRVFWRFLRLLWGFSSTFLAVFIVVFELFFGGMNIEEPPLFASEVAGAGESLDRSASGDFQRFGDVDASGSESEQKLGGYFLDVFFLFFVGVFF